MSWRLVKGRGNQLQVENGEQLTLSVLDGGQLLLHGLVRGFGEGFGGGTVAVVHQVGGHHPGRRRAESQSHRVTESTLNFLLTETKLLLRFNNRLLNRSCKLSFGYHRAELWNR